MSLARVVFVVLVALSLLVAVARANGQAEGEAWLAEVAQQPGITRTASGLLYRTLQEGQPDGAAPTAQSRVSVHYAGSLQSGAEFDSSYSRGQPAQFGVTQVISGWTEMLQLMREGQIVEVWIPSDKAYGARGAGGMIKPHTALKFKIELLKVIGGAQQREL